MKKIFYLSALSLCGFFSNIAWATNLVDVYKQALTNDPQYKAANAAWLANREVLPISRAALLPQLSAQGSVTRVRTHSEAAFFFPGLIPHGTYYSNVTNYSLTLAQPIFNFGSWANVWGAQAKVKQAEATYVSALENLVYRTAQAYFNVLQAEDVLRFTEANKEAVWRQLEQTKHRYEVGLIAITDLENTRASYDRANSDEISAKRDLADTFEKLSEITGIRYTELDTLKESFPLLTPNPNNNERWIKAAEQQNYDLTAARFTAIAARENIKSQFAGHLPTLNVNGGYTYNYNNNNTGHSDFARNKSAEIGLSLNVPLYQGGQVVAQTKQAEYQYQQAVATQEQTHRSVISQTNQAFLGVIAGISQVSAGKQLVKSTASALSSTEAGYAVGTRTMVDVLQAQSDYYNAQKGLAIESYYYINQVLLLKQQAGILSMEDLQIINSWLQKPKPIVIKNMAENSLAKSEKKPSAKIASTHYKKQKANKLTKKNNNRTERPSALSAKAR